MRKGKRFTPAWIRKAIADGRGTGTGQFYTPWHQIRRSDPGSRGRSHLIVGEYLRYHELLSDLERLAFAFATMQPAQVDVREQFPLSREEHPFHLAQYRASLTGQTAPGTLELAAAAGIRHPKLHKEGDQEHWIMSTDLLLTLEPQPGHFELVAVSAKYDEELEQKRTLELLALERAYWRRQGAAYLLFTPKLFKLLVAKTVVEALPWALVRPAVAQSTLAWVGQFAPSLQGQSITQALHALSGALGVTLFAAQQAFWQAVWAGVFPLDLNRFNLVSEEIRLLTPAQFWAQNPIVSRSSSWVN